MIARTDSACKFICEAGDWCVTNLQLQKILYFAQMVCLGQHAQRLCDTGFEAWDYGPVAPHVYRKVRMFGASPIEDVFYNALPFGAGSFRKEILAEVCRDLLPMRPGALVELTHWSEGAWAKNYVPGTRGIVIPEPDIIAEYAGRVSTGQITPDR